MMRIHVPNEIEKSLITYITLVNPNMNPEVWLSEERDVFVFCRTNIFVERDSEFNIREENVDGRMQLTITGVMPEFTVRDHDLIFRIRGGVITNGNGCIVDLSDERVEVKETEGITVDWMEGKNIYALTRDLMSTQAQRMSGTLVIAEGMDRVTYRVVNGEEVLSEAVVFKKGGGNMNGKDFIYHGGQLIFQSGVYTSDT